MAVVMFGQQLEAVTCWHCCLKVLHTVCGPRRHGNRYASMPVSFAILSCCLSVQGVKATSRSPMHGCHFLRAGEAPNSWRTGPWVVNIPCQDSACHTHTPLLCCIVCLYFISPTILVYSPNRDGSNPVSQGDNLALLLASRVGALERLELLRPQRKALERIRSYTRGLHPPARPWSQGYSCCRKLPFKLEWLQHNTELQHLAVDLIESGQVRRVGGTVQHGTGRCGAVRAMPCCAVPCRAVPCHAVRCGAEQCKLVQYSAGTVKMPAALQPSLTDAMEHLFQPAGCEGWYQQPAIATPTFPFPCCSPWCTHAACCRNNSA